MQQEPGGLSQLPDEDHDSAVLTVDALFSAVDTDDTGTVSFGEFERFWHERQRVGRVVWLCASARAGVRVCVCACACACVRVRVGGYIFLSWQQFISVLHGSGVVV